MDNFKRHIILLSGILVLLSGCQREQPPKAPIPRNLPDQVLSNATMVFTQNGVKTTVIKAKTISKWSNKDLTQAESLLVDFYDEKGEHTSQLVADSGWIKEKAQMLGVWGNVQVITDEKVKLETQTLNWDPNKRKITTEDFVKITKDEDVMTGYGLEADQELKNIKIKTEVKGEIVKKKNSNP
jgi:LPS export ABC transporter protein LptC